MEDKMDGVAEAVQKVRMVADKILPPRPHHLTLQPNRKYPAPTGFWFEGKSSRLQYMTNLSDADRGMLLTVPYYEIIEEPEAAQPVKSVLRTEARKKLSIKDYQNRKKSNSPADATNNDALARGDAKQGAAVDAGAAKEKDKTKPGVAQRLEENTGLQPHNVKTEDNRPDQNGDSDRHRAHLKPDSKSSSAPEHRKRQGDAEDTLPPQKRTRTDDAPKIVQPPDPKSDNMRGRDGTRESSTYGDSKAARDGRHSGATNGRLQALAHDRDQAPASARATGLVNGARPRAESSTSTSHKGDKADSSLKSSIPPLLSPLRVPSTNIPPLLSPLRLDTYDGTESPRKRPAGKAPAKGPVKAGGHSRATSMTKGPNPSFDYEPVNTRGQEGGRDAAEKRGQDKARVKALKERENQMPGKVSKRTVKIPPLLSPTLPPIVEAELARRKRADEASNRTSLASAPDSPASMKKTKPCGLSSQEEPDEPRKKSRIVTVKYKKSLKPRVDAILRLTSKSIKEAERRERLASVERTPPAKKRPRPAGDLVGEAVVAKKSKLSTEQSLPVKPTTAAPTTPRKNNAATAMSRVLSNTSQAYTPGDTTGLTPGAADRPPTSSDSHIDPVIAIKATALRNRYEEYRRLGSKLKRAKDAMFRDRDLKSMKPAEDKRAAALHFEMVLAYMIAFKALDQSLCLSRRPADYTGWESILPHFPELRGRLRPSRPLHALAIQIQAVIHEEIANAFTTLDDKTAMERFGRWSRIAKLRTRIWAEAQAMLEDGGLPEPKMRANIGPWSNTDDVVRSALTVLRRWAEREGVDWRSEIEIPAPGSAVNGT